MILARSAMAAALALLAGCASITPMEATAIRADRLALTEPTVVLACPARLVEVIDDRPQGESAGMYGKFDLRFEDAARLLREQLVQAGLAATPTAEGLAVTVRLKRLYMSQTNQVNTPVMVLDVTVDRHPAFVIRPKATTINWAGSEKELHAELQRGLAFANRDLVQALNRLCPSKQPRAATAH